MNKTKDFVSYEPKKKNRFIVRFIGSNLPEWTVNKVDFPKYVCKNRIFFLSSGKKSFSSS